MINGYLIIAMVSVLVAAFSQILLKKGAMRPHISFIRDYLNPPVIAGYMLMFGSVLATMVAYRGIDYMTVQIVEALGYIAVPVLSYIFFKESFTKNKFIGFALIIAGVIVYGM